MSQFASPRPVPEFFAEQAFSTKKERKTPRQNVPPTPRQPSFSCPGPQRPHVISFKAVKSDTALAHSPFYNESIGDTFFNQCFVIERRIGAGSFGDVFCALNKEDKKLYAVKRSRYPFRGIRDRLAKLEEVKKLEILPKHPNCVEFFKAWEERQHLYIQFELCKTSLSDFAEENHEIPESVVWQFLVDLLLAVQHLHSHNFIHMDIKPDNIFLTADGMCKLGDFGLVVDLRSEVANSERSEGDARYLAPEVLQGEISKAADIFSLGITFLELASDLDLPSNGPLWHELRSGQLPANVTHGISEDLKLILRWMMTPDPNQRPTATQLLNHPILKSYRRRRFLQVSFQRLTRSLKTLFSMPFVLLTLIFNWLLLPYGLLSRKMRNGNGLSRHTPEPTRQSFIDFSYSDDEGSELFHHNDSTLGRPLDTTSSMNSSFGHPIEQEAPAMSSTPVVVKPRPSIRSSRVARKIIKPPSPAPKDLSLSASRHEEDNDPLEDSLQLGRITPRKTPRKLSLIFDSMGSDSE